MQGRSIASAETVTSAIVRFEGPLTRYAAHILGDRDRARDVVQDTFVRLWETDTAQIAQLRDWLYTVCRNRAIDVKRRERRTSRSEREPELPTSADATERSCVVSEIFALVDTLPAAQRRVLQLRYRDGHSYRRISQATGLSTGGVGAVIHHGIRGLRSRLGVGMIAVALMVVVAALIGEREPLTLRAVMPKPPALPKTDIRLAEPAVIPQLPPELKRAPASPVESAPKLGRPVVVPHCRRERDDCVRYQTSMEME